MHEIPHYYLTIVFSRCTKLSHLRRRAWDVGYSDNMYATIEYPNYPINSPHTQSGGSCVNVWNQTHFISSKLKLLFLKWTNWPFCFYLKRSFVIYIIRNSIEKFNPVSYLSEKSFMHRNVISFKIWGAKG